MEVDRPSDFIFNEVERAPRRAALFARHGDAPDALGGPFHKGVNMGLPRRSDYHDVIRAVPGRHAHATHVVFEPP